MDLRFHLYFDSATLVAEFRHSRSAGILPAVSGMLPDNTDNNGMLRGAGRNRLSTYVAQEIAGNMPATAGNMPALPDRLLWTWFVDNPRWNLQ